MTYRIKKLVTLKHQIKRIIFFRPQITTMKKGLVFLHIFLLLFVLESYSQDFCAQRLSEAEDRFERGRFYEIPDMLSLCINNGFTKEEKVRAYRLLTLTYLYLDYHSKADENYLSLLSLSPEYRVNDEIDPRELINHHKKFTTRPFVYYSVKVGMNVSDYRQLVDYSLTVENADGQKIKRSVGYHLNLGTEITLKNNLLLGIEGSLTRKSFQYSNMQFGVSGLPGFQTNLKQNYTLVEVPVYLKYSFLKPKVSPFVLAGLAPSYLLAAYSVNNQKVDMSPGQEVSRDEPNIDLLNARRQINYSVIAGVGVKYKIGINYLTFELRYQAAMLNYVNKDSRYDMSLGSGEIMRFGLNYIDDDFKLNHLSALIGFTYPIYRPRKIVP